MPVERLALVVQRRHTHAGSRDLAGHVDALRPRNALREHEGLELLARECALGAKHGDIEIFVERNLSRLERANRFLVPVLKIVGIYSKVLDRDCPLLAVPAIAAEHAADVEQDEIDRRVHPSSTARAGAPSSPARRNGKTRSSYGPSGGPDRSRPSTMMTPRS